MTEEQKNLIKRIEDLIKYGQNNPQYCDGRVKLGDLGLKAPEINEAMAATRWANCYKLVRGRGLLEIEIYFKQRR